MGDQDLQNKDQDLLKADDGSDAKKGSYQDRINILTKNWRTTERALEDSNSGREDDRKLMREMGEHTKKLTNTVEELRNSTVKNKEDDVVQEIEGQIEKVESEIMTATKDENWGQVTALNMKIRNLDRKLVKLQNKPVDPNEIAERVEKKVVENTSGNTSNTADQIAIENFKRDNDWYGKDNKMRRFADNISFDLAATGKYKTHSELLNAVKVETEKEFEYKPTTGFNNVENGSYGGYDNNNISEVTDLTPVQKTMADNMNISHADFLKSVKATAGGKQ